ncbi:hypothetical protein RHS01_05437 [Rhizoctonia solani]|uniref:Uncharacterized protein n=1 Tax=Rhizoctonia solani TaxID=456999 RepID=A0A8H7IB67_9AGAM|nr:hypothetical protein RHS01_05437 [Rhizoctonia solani]
MATRSRTASCAQSPFDQGYMEPTLPPTTSVKHGKVSLERVTRLLLGLLDQVERLEREIAKIKEAGIKTQTNIENISQTVDVVKDGLRSLQSHGPQTPEGPQARQWKKRHAPYQKPSLLDWLVGSPSGQKHQGPPRSGPANPKKSCSPASPISPTSPRLQSPIGAPAPLPPAPAAHYPAPRQG